MARYMLTTIDNPFNPFTQFDDWYAYDIDMGYYSCSLLGRITITSDNLSDADQDLATELAIDEIIHENILGIYKKVSMTSTIESIIQSLPST